METCDMHEDCIVVYDNEVGCPVCKLESRANLRDALVAACERSLNTYSPNECDCDLYDEGKICPACELRAVLAKCEKKGQ